MAKDQVLGRLRFDTSLLDQQINDAQTRLNLLRNMVAQAQREQQQMQKQITQAQQQLHQQLQSYVQLQQQLNTQASIAGGKSGGKSGSGGGGTQVVDTNQVQLLSRLKEAVSELAKARREYDAAVKSGNDQNQKYWLDEARHYDQLSQQLQKQLATTNSATREFEKYEKIVRDVDPLQRKFSDTVRQTTENLSKAYDNNRMQQVKAAITDIKTAYSELNKSIRAGDNDGIAYWGAEIERRKDVLDHLYDEMIKDGQLSYETLQRIVGLISEADVAQGRMAKETEKTRQQMLGQADAAKQAQQQMQQMVAQAERWLATMLVLRGVKQLWNNAKEYAASYYDALNEIRIVTKMTEEEADALGVRYRALASEMSVSSQEVAQAAIEYWRQGLNEQQVDERMRATIAYAKISAMDFTEAAELMTAATNSMGIDAMKVADVWAYLGDASASGADEVGTAMQKVSAVAKTAGIEFEWLGAYIATLTEKTRQAPEAIGTALNAILARLQQIKAKGFNSDDIYGINDIAKALGALEKPIALMDEVTGEWRDIPTIFNEIAAQWQNLTDKEKAYIATTMGGTRQRNYLLTLLDDLSKAAENGSRAWELYAGAQQAAGTAMEKYAIWEESVEAAQGRLTAEMERLYSVLDSDVLKGFYNVLSSIVGWINDAAEATDGWNVKIGLIAGVITLLTVVIFNLVTNLKAAAAAAVQTSASMAATGVAAAGATAGISAMNMALMATVAGIVIAGIASLVGWLISLGDAAGNAAKNTHDLAESLSGDNSHTGDIKQSIADVKTLAEQYTGAASDVEAFKAMRDQLIAQYPALKNMLHKEVDDVSDLNEAYGETIRALERLSSLQVDEQWRQAHEGRREAESTFSTGRSAYWSIGDRGKNHFLYDPDVNTPDQLFQPGSAGMQADPSRMGIRQLRGYISSMKYFMEDMRLALNDASPDVIASWEAVYNEWVDRLYNDFIPTLDQKTTEANQQIMDAVRVIVTDAINVYKNADFKADIPHMIESIMKEDWIERAATDANFTTADVEAYVDQFVDEYMNIIKSAQEAVTEAVNNADLMAPSAIGDEGDTVGDWILKRTLTFMQNHGIDENTIVDVLEPLFTAMGMARDELIQMLLEGNGETGGEGGGSNLSFDEKLEQAFAYLEKVNTLREAIAEILAGGTMTDDLYDNLMEVIGPEALAAMVEGATNALGELDLSAFLEALRERLAELELEEPVDENGNPLLKALGINEDSEKAVQEAMEKIANAADVDALAQIWAALPQKVKDALGDTGKEVEEVIKNAADGSEDAAARVEKALTRIRNAAQMKDLITNNKVWSDLDDIINDLSGTVEEANGAIGNITDHLHDAAEAAGALEAAAAGDTDALDYLANLTGLTADVLANDLTPAELAVMLMGDQASASMEYLANMLWTVGAITIDPSGKVSAIGSIEQAANAAGMTVANLAAALAAMNGSSLSYQVTANGIKVTSRVPAIKWTGASGSKKSGGGGSRGGGGGGGGGGGSGSNSVSELVEAMVDAFSKVNEIRNHRRELAQLGQSYHEARGELQGVIAYLEAERSIVEEDTVAQESYLSQLEAQIEANKAVITTQAEGSKAYNQAMLDLDKLQDEHMKYSQQLIKNQTDVENLTKAIKEQNDKIRQMEIDLRNTILEAVEDREASEERMLSGRIELENEILSLIRKRYEAERDEIIDTQNLRKQALQDEIDQIDELLAERKKLADHEDKMAEIAKLEDQIARISADPTRQKEALQLQEKLAKLREDLAWDTAEAEAQAQKDSIKKQITSIDDYIAYVNDYYEQLFKNPQLLIEEMEEIMTWTDDQIIAWLKKNSEDYATSTAATQRKMVKDWQDTLDDMRDTIRTYWDEIETIIEGGAENIISFLTTYSRKYREAGKLQAEAYVDEWRKQLSDLEAAHRQVVAKIEAYDYAVTKQVKDSGGGGGGSGGGGGGGTTVSSAPKKTYYRWEYLNTSGNWVTSTKNVVEQSAFEGAKKYAMDYWSKFGGNMTPIILQAIAGATMSSPGKYLRRGTPLYEYATGGLNTSTGLAWLDGTKSRPERILSSHQTELFEDMINTLHAIRTLRVNYNMASPTLRDANALPNIETINITVESLNDDVDVEDSAKKLMNAFYTEVARTRPVGGIQGW